MQTTPDGADWDPEIPAGPADSAPGSAARRCSPGDPRRRPCGRKRWIDMKHEAHRRNAAKFPGAGAAPLVAGLALAGFASVLAVVPAATWWGTAALSLGSGIAAMSLMAAAAVLGARWKWVESAFGGLDRVYEAHKWLGVWALVFTAIHF